MQNACFGWQLICHGTKLPRKKRKLCSSQLPPSVVFNHFFRQHFRKLETLVLPDSVLQARSKGEQDHHASKSRGTSRDRHSHTTPIFPYEIPCSYGSVVGSVDMGMGGPTHLGGDPWRNPWKARSTRPNSEASTLQMLPSWQLSCHKPHGKGLHIIGFKLHLSSFCIISVLSRY